MADLPEIRIHHLALEEPGKSGAEKYQNVYRGSISYRLPDGRSDIWSNATVPS